MNGRIYTCEGCGRTGAVEEVACHYECPVCRWLAPLEGRERARSWITWNTIFGHAPYPKPKLWLEDRREKLERSQCEARQRLAGDAKTQWKRRYQFARFLRRQTQA